MARTLMLQLDYRWENRSTRPRNCSKIITCESLTGRVNTLITDSTPCGAYREAVMKTRYSNDHQFVLCIFARYMFYT